MLDTSQLFFIITRPFAPPPNLLTPAREGEEWWWVSLKSSVCVCMWVRFLRNTTAGKSKRTHCGSLRAVVKRALYAIFTYRRRISNAADVGVYCLRRTKTIVYKTVLSNLFSFAMMKHPLPYIDSSITCSKQFNYVWFDKKIFFGW